MGLSLSISGIRRTFYSSLNTDPKLESFEQFPRWELLSLQAIYIFLPHIEQIPVIDFIHWLHSLHRASLLPLQHANSEYLERAIMSSLNLSFSRVNISSSFIYSFPLLHILVALPSQWHHKILNWDWLLLVYSLQWWLMTYRLLCCWTWKLNLSQNQRMGTHARYFLSWLGKCYLWDTMVFVSYWIFGRQMATLSKTFRDD